MCFLNECRQCDTEVQVGNERPRAGHVGGECTAAPGDLDKMSSLVVKNDFAQPVLPLKRDI